MRRLSAGRAALFAVTGLAIGWLVGLSASPVLGVVLTSVMGSLAAVAAALPATGVQRRRGGSKDEDDGGRAAGHPPDAPALLCALVVTTAIGATLGLWARTHEWLAPSDVQLVRHWTALGLDERQVRERLFAARFPLDRAPEAHRQPVLFHAGARECEELTTLSGRALRSAAQASTSAAVAELARSGLDDAGLEQALKALCKE